MGRPGNKIHELLMGGLESLATRGRILVRVRPKLIALPVQADFQRFSGLSDHDIPEWFRKPVEGIS